MNSAPENPATPDSPLLILILAVPGLPPYQLAFPEGNLIATSLLSDLVDLKLELAGQKTDPAKYGGPFNSAIVIFCVRQIQQSMQIVCEVLERTKLTPYAEIYCFDPREMMYRCVFPASTNGILAAELLSRLQTIGAGLQSTGNLLVNLLSQRPPDIGGNPS